MIESGSNFQLYMLGGKHGLCNLLIGLTSSGVNIGELGMSFCKNFAHLACDLLGLQVLRVPLTVRCDFRCGGEQAKWNERIAPKEDQVTWRPPK